jgi:hypothetical protein
MDLTSLIAMTRSLAGDPSYEGNSTAWTDDEIVTALNWAQTRYAELTHCTYKEEPATAATGADGIFTVPPGFILIDRVMIPDPPTTGPNATITAPASSPNGAVFSASVPSQAGATFFWSVAGGSMGAGQGTNTISVTGMALVGAVVTVSCLVTLGGLRDVQSVDVHLT